MAKKTMTFEAAMERLEEILAALEGGNENLDQTLSLYEEGIKLIRACSDTLEKAEQSVKILQLQADGSAVLADFKPTEDDR